MKQETHKFVVRLPAQLRDQVAEAARHYRRSMNSEMVARLEQSFGALPQGAVERQLEPPLHPHMEAILRSTLSETERSLISVFRRLGSARQKALLALLN